MSKVPFGCGLLLQAIGMGMVLVLFVAQIRSNDAYVGMAAALVGLPVALLSALLTLMITTYSAGPRDRLNNRLGAASKTMLVVTVLPVLYQFAFAHS